MPLEDELLQRELALVIKGEQDVALLRRFMQGGVDELIDTEGGTLHSLLHLQKLFFDQFGYGLKQYIIPAKNVDEESWQQIAVIPSQAQGSDNPDQDMILVVAGNEPISADGGLQIVRMSIRKGTVLVQNLTEFESAGRFGLVDVPSGVQLWLHSEGRRNRLLINVMNDGGGRITFDTGSQSTPPAGVAYVDPIVTWTSQNLDPETLTKRSDTEALFSGLIEAIENATNSISGVPE